MSTPSFDLDKIISSQDRNRGRVQYAKKENEFKPTPGQYTVRLLSGGPSITTDPDFFFEPSCTHKLVGVNTTFYSCLKMARNERCPICNFVSKLYDSGIESNKELAKEIKRFTRYSLNVVVREQADKGVQIWKIGEKLKAQIIEGIKALRAEGQDWDITSARGGRDLNLIVKQIPGQKWYEYSCTLKYNASDLAPTSEEANALLEGRFELSKQYNNTVLTQQEMTDVLIDYLAENQMDDLTKLVARGAAGGARVVRPTLATAVQHSDRQDAPVLPPAVVTEDVEEEEEEEQPVTPIPAKNTEISKRLSGVIKSLAS